MLNGWPWLILGLLWDYVGKWIGDFQINLASDWGWGRSVRITSQVVFCVLGRNTSYRRTREDHEQTVLFCFVCFLLGNGVGERRRRCILLRALLAFVFSAKGMLVLKSELVSKDYEKFLCSGCDVLCRVRGWFCCLLFVPLYYWPWEYMYFT